MAKNLVHSHKTKKSPRIYPSKIFIIKIYKNSIVVIFSQGLPISYYIQSSSKSINDLKPKQLLKTSN